MFDRTDRLARYPRALPIHAPLADVAQLVEHFTRNKSRGGSGGEVGTQRDARVPVNAALSSIATGTRLTHDIAARTEVAGQCGPGFLDAGDHAERHQCAGLGAADHDLGVCPGRSVLDVAGFLDRPLARVMG